MTLKPASAELPQMTDSPERGSVPDKTELPQTTALPQITELPQMTEAALTVRVMLPLFGLIVTVGDSAAPVVAGASAVLAKAAVMSNSPAPTAKISCCSL